MTKTRGRKQDSLEAVAPGSAPARERLHAFMLGAYSVTTPESIFPVLHDEQPPAAVELSRRKGQQHFITECALLREAALLLSGQNNLRSAFNRALTRVINAKVSDFRRALALRRAVADAASALVEFAHPRRNWFDLGLAAGNWLLERDAILRRLLLADLNSNAPRIPSKGYHGLLRTRYEPPSFRPIVDAALRIDRTSANDVPPVRLLQEVAARTSQAAEIRDAFEGFGQYLLAESTLSPTRAKGAEEWEADALGMHGFLCAMTAALVPAACDRQPRPLWDRSLGQLWMAGVEAKKIVVSRAGQVVPILDMFEERAWPDRIDLPRGPESERRGTRPLRDNALDSTVKSLNTGLKGLRFGVRTGGVFWRRTDADE